MLKNELADFGLNQKESKVYLALLELGEASVLSIAQKSGLKRTSVYNLLEVLKERGLVGTVSKRKKQNYFAQNPKKIESELEEKQLKLKKIMPELLSLANLIDKKPKIQYFEGVGGIKSILDDELASNQHEFIGWCTEGYREFLGERYFMDYFTPKRIEKKIYFRFITPISDHYQMLQTRSQQHFWKIKMMSFGELTLETDIVLYGKSKISIISYSEKIGLIVESATMFNTLKAIFESQWILVE
ncbi:MAG: helix-turn-helix domain-containing protein [Parcubacteria group bacterium]|jgi:sugar-specific transcriptional regulator TrmB